MPVRQDPTAHPPYLVLDGDAPETRWSTARLSGAELPRERSPARGFSSSANNDPFGFTADGDPTNDDYLILLAEGRLVNLGNATGHPSRIMDGSFANQVLAQIFLFEQKFADLSPEKKAERLTVEVLPKKLDEEVALEMVKGFGGVVTQLTKQQADYIGVTVEGPFKPDTYRY